MYRALVRIEEEGPFYRPATVFPLVDLALARFPNDPLLRRQVIVLFEDRDHDYGSALDPETLPALAANADATLYVVVGRPAWVPSKVNVVAQFLSRSGIDLGTSDLQIALRDAARATGGDAFAPATPALDFPRAFRDMVEDFRRSYLLGFTPSGDRRPGFHKLTVKVKNGNGLTIRARSGYFQK